MYYSANDVTNTWRVALAVSSDARHWAKAAAPAGAQTMLDQQQRRLDIHDLLLDLPPVQAPAALGAYVLSAILCIAGGQAPNAALYVLITSTVLRSQAKATAARKRSECLADDFERRRSRARRC